MDENDLIQTTISLSAEPTEVEEGKQLRFNFSLTEAVSEGGLVVDLDLVEDTDPLPGDITYFVDGSENVTAFELIIDEESGLIDQAIVTLAEGATEATLVNDVIADNATEGPESVTFGLAESDDYAIDSEDNAASFTILDTSTDTTPIEGTDASEVLVGTDADGTILAAGDDDTVAGGLGDDEIDGGTGDDVLRGDLNSRSPQVNVPGGDDTIRGGEGSDRIGGKSGDDLLFGDAGDDVIFGDNGDDTINGGAGSDTLTGDDFSGGTGADTFVLSLGEGTDIITDFGNGNDLIQVLGTSDFSAVQDGSDALIVSGEETLAILTGVNTADVVFA